MLAADVLSDAGFTVLESTNAEEALRLLETRSDVQVLFTDVNMPDALDGLGLAQTVHERLPEVGIEPYRVFRRLLILEGWSHDQAHTPVFS